MALVVLTREAPLNDELHERLKDLADVLEVPLSVTRYAAEAAVASAIASSSADGTFATLALTSARSARYAPVALGHCARDAVVAVVGEKTAAAVRSACPGARVVVSNESTARDLAAVIEQGPVLALGARDPRPELAEVLDERGIELVRVACYETTPAVLDIEGREAIASADVVVIAAPSAWEIARFLVSRDATIVVTGETTFAAVASTHERVVNADGDLAGAVVAALAGDGGAPGDLT